MLTFGHDYHVKLYIFSFAQWSHLFNFFSRAEEVAHFFISPGKSAMTVLHPG